MKFAMLAIILSACTAVSEATDNVIPEIASITRCDMHVVYGLDIDGFTPIDEFTTYRMCVANHDELLIWIDNWINVTCTDKIRAKAYGNGGRCEGGCEAEKYNLCKVEPVENYF